MKKIIGAIFVFIVALLIVQTGHNPFPYKGSIFEYQVPQSYADDISAKFPFVANYSGTDQVQIPAAGSSTTTISHSMFTVPGLNTNSGGCSLFASDLVFNDNGSGVETVTSSTNQLTFTTSCPRLTAGMFVDLSGGPLGSPAQDFGFFQLSAAPAAHVLTFCTALNTRNANCGTNGATAINWVTFANATPALVDVVSTGQNLLQSNQVVVLENLSVGVGDPNGLNQLLVHHINFKMANAPRSLIMHQWDMTPTPTGALVGGVGQDVMSSLVLSRSVSDPIPFTLYTNSDFPGWGCNLSSNPQYPPGTTTAMVGCAIVGEENALIQNLDSAAHTPNVFVSYKFSVYRGGR